jgi:hypothetical protein
MTDRDAERVHPQVPGAAGAADRERWQAGPTGRDGEDE